MRKQRSHLEMSCKKEDDIDQVLSKFSNWLKEEGYLLDTNSWKHTDFKIHEGLSVKYYPVYYPSRLVISIHRENRSELHIVFSFEKATQVIQKCRKQEILQQESKKS